MPNWTKEQELAIEKSGENIIVSAGAGSGKTAVLTERVIRKLKQGVDISSLLILTFTKAAATEMKERIRSALKKENLKDQLDKIDASFITTFDSFSLAVVKKYYYLMNLNPNIKVANSLILKWKKEEILENIFNDLYNKLDTNFLNFLEKYTTKDDEIIKKNILDFYDKLDLKYDRDSYLNNYMESFYQESYIDFRIQEFVSLLKKRIKIIDDNLKNIKSLVDEDFYNELNNILEPLILASDYSQIKKNIEISLPRLKKGMTDVKIYKDSISKELQVLKKFCIYDDYQEIVSSIENTKEDVALIIDILKRLGEEFDHFKKEHNLYDFIDISKLAIQIVSQYEVASSELRNTFSEILVDEYQDTSDLQEIFISKISNNNVYMVGDIKQSIYRFRNANPNLFKEKYLAYANHNNGFKIDLLKNFRSREETLNNINHVFNFIMDIDIGGADYKKSHQMIFGNNTYNEFQMKDNNYNFEIYNYEYLEKDFSKEEIEAFITVYDIQEKMNNHFQIYDKNINSLRDIKYSDFAILMDKSTSFELYKKIFEYSGINLTIIKDENISDSNDLALIKNILVLLKNVHNKNSKEWQYAYLSIGRSYLFSLEDQILYDNIKNNSYFNDPIVEIIENLTRELEYLPLPKLIQKIVISFSFYEKLILVGNIEEAIIRLDYIENLALELNDLGYTYEDFILYLDKLITDSLKMEYSLNKEVDNSVKIMTIHKSKGLEFPICYYTGLYHRFNDSISKQRFLFDTTYGFMLPYISNGLKNTIYHTLYRNSNLKEDISEKIRLFYVALTRAKEKMILITSLNDKDLDDNEIVNLDTRLKYNSFTSILNSLSNHINEYIKEFDLHTINLTKNYTLYKSNTIFEKIKPTNLSLEVEELDISKDEIVSEQFSKAKIYLLSPKEKEQIEFGKKIHSLFESFDFLEKDFQDIPISFQKYLDNFLNSKLLKDIKKAKIYKEYEFLYMENNIKKRGIIDLLLEYEDYIDIIDYKLKNIDDEAYIKQLQGYKKYIENKTKKRVNCYLYSILDNFYQEII